MKKLFLFLFPVFFLIGCSTGPADSVAVSILEDDNTTFIIVQPNSPRNYLANKENTVINGKYFLLPPSDKDFVIDSVTSTDDSVIEITSVDYDNHTFTAYSKKTGEAKIRVIIGEHYYSSLKIVVNK